MSQIGPDSRHDSVESTRRSVAVIDQVAESPAATEAREPDDLSIVIRAEEVPDFVAQSVTGTALKYEQHDGS